MSKKYKNKLEQAYNEEPQMIFNQTELELINRLFGENKQLLMLIRKSFLQGELTNDEFKLLKAVEGKEIKSLLQKTFLPKLDVNSGINNLADEWINLDFQSVELADLSFQTRQIQIDYLAQELRRLWTQEKPKMLLSDLIYQRKRNKEKNYIRMRARQSLFQSLEINFFQLKVLAGNKTKTSAQIEYERKVNSNK